MKKFILAAALLLIGATAANAQKINVHAGYAYSTWRGDSGSALHGVRVGASYDLTLNASETFSLRPGLNYTFAMDKGNHLTNNNGFVLVSSNISEHTVALPIHLKYSFTMGEKSRFYLFAGPGMSYGVSFKTKYKFTPDPDVNSPLLNNYDGYISRDFFTGEATSDIDDPQLVADYEQNGIPPLSRFDVFASGGAGVQIGRIFLEASYDYGLLNRFKDKNDGTIGRDQLNVSIGYTF